MAGIRKAAAAAVVGLGMVVTATLTAAPTATAGEEEEVPTGGPVTGKIVAHNVNYNVIGLCSSECIDSNKVTDEVEGNHLLDVSKEGVVRSQEDAIPAGTYRIAFTGSAYARTGGRFGYLRRTVAGRYHVVKRFEKATEFTVVEGEALKLGTLNTHAGRAWSRDNLYGYTYGGGEIEMTGMKMKVHGFDFPKGGTLVVRTVGCEGKVYKKRYRRSGKFTLVWDDPKAYKHYNSKRVRYKFILRREGDLPQVLKSGWTDWSDHADWKCN